MHIGVIGAGQLGATLAGWCAESGHDVAVTSRHPDRLGGLVDRLGGHGTAMSVAEAAAFADVVLFAPAWESAQEAIDLAAGNLAGKVVIDATNPLGGLPPGEHSGLETLMHRAPEAHWVKALNTLPARVLEQRRGHDPLLAEFVCTDLRDARVAASRIIRDMGFAPVYAGGAPTARLTETGGPLQLTEVDIGQATEALAEALATEATAPGAMAAGAMAAGAMAAGAMAPGAMATGAMIPGAMAADATAEPAATRATATQAMAEKLTAPEPRTTTPPTTRH